MSLAKNLRLLWESKKLYPFGGSCGQTAGIESYRLLATGNQFFVMVEAADELDRLTDELAAAKRDVERLREASQVISDHITHHPTRDFDIPDEIYIPWIDAIRGRPITADIAAQQPTEE